MHRSTKFALGLMAALFATLLACPASAQEETWDQAASMEEVERIRDYCVEMADEPFCVESKKLTDEEILENLKRLRASCRRWEALESEIRDVQQRYPEMSLAILPVMLRFTCNIPVGARAHAYLRASTSPDLLERRVDAAAERIEAIQRAEEKREELLERLGDAFLSLELQREQGSLRAKDYEKLKKSLEDCEKLTKSGPSRVARGLDGTEWSTKAQLCTDTASGAVFERATDEEEGSGLVTWLFFFGAIVIAGGLSLVIVRRRERHSGVLTLETWRARLDELDVELEAAAADAETDSDISIYNAHMARATALRRWVDHFGRDARAHDVETSLNSANLSERNYTWFGYSDRPIPPVAAVSGTPIDFFARLYRATGRSTDDLNL